MKKMKKKPSSDKQKGHLFEIENAQIFINLLFYVTYKQHFHFRIKGMPFKRGRY